MCPTLGLQGALDSLGRLLRGPIRYRDLYGLGRKGMG